MPLAIFFFFSHACHEP